jgi:8-oxo-dGTP pyrophosphatase MutT (NUDIX family)
VTPPDFQDGAVRAAGGVVVRSGPGGEAEVLLVHRPRYDDWSWPKGKCDPGESYEGCARREVEEETGIVVDLDEPLPEVRYRDQKDRPKLVRYWVMRPASEPGPFEPNEEVDEVAWLRLAEAEDRLSYDHDRGLLANLRRLT